MISFGPKVDKIIVIFFLVFLPLFGAFVMWKHYNPKYRTDISELAKDPKWDKLTEVHSNVDSTEFEEKLTRYFAVGDTWKKEIEIKSDGLYNNTGELLYQFDNNAETKPTYWRTKDQMPERPKDKPLQGIRIALDPGHIGGQCAKLEERWFKIGDSLPVMEGEMTLVVAQIIKPKLEELGAIVTLTREVNEPVGTSRSPHFMALAKAKVEELDKDPSLIQSYADKMFYRTAEIRARARKVNKKLRPDMMVALHFNALGWNDPNNPTLVEDNNFHILLNGAYTSGEVLKADQRFEMIRRILEGTIDEEIALSKAFVNSFKKETQLPPYRYEPNSTRAKPVDNEGYVWARNLLANRLYECPTIFLEPYIMNSKPVFDRVQLGDYYGEKEVNGEMRKSIFREYADAVVGALVEYYSE